MTTTTSGNPHSNQAEKYIKEAYYADDMGVREIAKATAEATLALAYEQRTANMIAAFAQLVDDESVTFLGERFDGYELAREIKARLITVNPQRGEVAVPTPLLPTKAVGSKDSSYLLTAARNINQGYGVGGSGVKAMVIKLLTDTAEAMEAEGN